MMPSRNLKNPEQHLSTGALTQGEMQRHADDGTVRQKKHMLARVEASQIVVLPQANCRVTRKNWKSRQSKLPQKH